MEKEYAQGGNNMYYLVENITVFDFDNSNNTVRLLSKSKDKEKLQEEIKKIFLNAVNNEDVEFISDYERAEINVDDEEWKDSKNFSELSITHTPDRCKCLREEYNVVSDENTPEL